MHSLATDGCRCCSWQHTLHWVWCNRVLLAFEVRNHWVCGAYLQDVTTGDTLCDEKKPIILERMEFPDPVIKVRRLRLTYSDGPVSASYSHFGSRAVQQSMC